MDTSEKMELFRELVRCGGEVYTWRCGADGAVIEHNCPDGEVLSAAFSLLGCQARMLDHRRDRSTPILLGSPIGIIWGAAFGGEDQTFLIGPVFSTDVDLSAVREGFETYVDAQVDMAWKHKLIDALYRVPTVPYIVFSREVLMLHYCLTGERLGLSDLNVVDMQARPGRPEAPGHRDRYRVWSAEQALLQMVRNGDLDYKGALDASSRLSNGVPLKSRDPLRQLKTSTVVFCSIVCRAAIEGGLSPEEAYALGDAYIQNCENARSMDELMSIAPTMYDDFIRRVHRRRTNPELSPPVQKCVDYIELHLNERIRAADLAALAGYGEYYITQKFRRETGTTVNDYVKFAKVERAKVLLRGTGRTVQDIADELGFSSRSHFSQSFREVTGQSPADYRAGRPNGPV